MPDLSWALLVTSIKTQTEVHDVLICYPLKKKGQARPGKYLNDMH